MVSLLPRHAQDLPQAAGARSLRPGFDEEAWADPERIDPERVAFAVLAVREDRKLSHYTDNEYARVHRRQLKTISDAYRNIAKSL